MGRGAGLEPTPHTFDITPELPLGGRPALYWRVPFQVHCMHVDTEL
jgi:hypothetical protein